ncbi:hypothetical protein Hanom_Chr14g01305011 [Helianthus anomalus]
MPFLVIAFLYLVIRLSLSLICVCVWLLPLFVRLPHFFFSKGVNYPRMSGVLAYVVLTGSAQESSLTQ